MSLSKSSIYEYVTLFDKWKYASGMVDIKKPVLSYILGGVLI